MELRAFLKGPLDPVNKFRAKRVTEYIPMLSESAEERGIFVLLLPGLSVRVQRLPVCREVAEVLLNPSDIATEDDLEILLYYVPFVEVICNQDWFWNVWSAAVP